MIFLTKNTDGWDEEGIGCICQWNLFLFCIAKELGVQISVPPFKNIAHYEYTKYSSEEWSKSFTNFFKFPYETDYDLEFEFSGTYENLKTFVDENLDHEQKILIHIPKMFVVEYGQSNIDVFFHKKYLREIRNNLSVDDTYFSPDAINISLHIRYNNPKDVDFSGSREYFLRRIDSSKFKNLIEDLKNKYNNDIVHLHIHSQGSIDNFYDIINLSTDNFQIFCHLNDHPTKDIYHMSNADFLIMANSSYSWICHLLNENPTYVRDNFWHSVYPNAIFLDSDYKIKL
jgi:hypothetical protein